MRHGKSGGTEEERCARAAGEIQRVIANAREAGIPDHGKFCGYVVQVPAKNDFLANVMADKGAGRRDHCRSPEHAIRYASRDQAYQAAAKLQYPGVVGVLFDVDSEFIVVFDARPAEVIEGLESHRGDQGDERLT